MTGIPPRGAGYRGGTTPRTTKPVPPTGSAGIGTQREAATERGDGIRFSPLPTDKAQPHPSPTHQPTEETPA